MALGGGEWSAPRLVCFIPLERVIGTQWTEGCVGTRANLNTGEKTLVPAMNWTTIPWSPRLQPAQNTGWAILAPLIKYERTNLEASQLYNKMTDHVRNEPSTSSMWNDSESKNMTQWLEREQDYNDVCTYAQNYHYKCVMFKNLNTTTPLWCPGQSLWHFMQIT